MNLNDGETPNAAHFPGDDGARAVDMPLTEILVDAANGRIEPRGDHDTRHLDTELNSSSFQKVRSVLIVSEFDFRVKNMYNSPVSMKAGVRSLEGIPETEKFTIDLGLNTSAAGNAANPEEAVFAVYLFNTPYPQLDAETIGFEVSKDIEEFKVDSASYDSAVVVPGSAVDQERFKVDNTDSADLDARLSTIDAGKVTPEDEATAVTDGHIFENLPSADFYLLELRQNGGSSTTADVVFRGESQ